MLQVETLWGFLCHFLPNDILVLHGSLSGYTGAMAVVMTSVPFFLELAMLYNVKASLVAD